MSLRQLLCFTAAEKIHFFLSPQDISFETIRSPGRHQALLFVTAVLHTISDCLFPSSTPFQNTYTNADKLLEAAEQLAQTGECDPEEIYKAARHLEVRIQDFVRRVEHRKLLLDMSVSFHTHTKEVGDTNKHTKTQHNTVDTVRSPAASPRTTQTFSKVLVSSDAKINNSVY